MMMKMAGEHYSKVSMRTRETLAPQDLLVALVHRQILGRMSRTIPQVSQMTWHTGCAAWT